MDNNLDDQLLIMEANIEAKRQDSDDKMKNLTEDLTAMITSIMGQIKVSKYSIDNKDSPKAQYPTAVAPDKNRSPPSEGGNYTKIGGM